MRARRITLMLGIFALVALTCLVGARPERASASGNVSTLLSLGADNGQFTSLALDASGMPVISYFQGGTSDLKVLHCGNVNCSSGNTTASPDTTDAVGQWTSLELDGSGFPVVSYYDLTNSSLKVLHCG
ncbi:MAG: hypothetical protein Q8S13_05575, partial [Dehalococcoidia bacterium]|nr:hypothetical protein [Dehalococcoidia bacterium]